MARKLPKTKRLKRELHEPLGIRTRKKIKRKKSY